MKATWLADAALLATVAVFLVAAPYTKVEELFNIQAIHDILNHGVFSASSLEKFDHQAFPGVVPRTFVGSLAIAAVVRAIDFFYTLVSGKSLLSAAPDQLHVQLLARGVLGAANVASLMLLRNSLTKITRRRASSKSALFTTVFMLSQFHILFYASRTLPNFVALPLVNYALSKILAGNMAGLTWLAFVGVIFRLEVGVFGVAIAFTSSLIFGQSNFLQCIFMLAVGLVVGLGLTFSIDSYFWGRATVPELEAFVFNVVSGNSAKWGVEPYAAYFKKYILNFFRPPHVLIFSIFGFLEDPVIEKNPPVTSEKQGEVITHPAKNSLRILAVSALLFVSIMSFQPHKEWRFIVYIVPVFFLLAGNGAARLWRERSKSFGNKLLLLLMLGSWFVSIAVSSFMAFASSFNYPGGDAIRFVNGVINAHADSSPVLVHMDVPACMTGITKFTELHDGSAIYDKTENEHELAKIWNDVTYLITHKNMQEPLASDLIVYQTEHWNHLALVPAFAGVNVLEAVKRIRSFYNDPSARRAFLSDTWLDVKAGKLTTLSELVKSFIVFRDALFVYKRIAPDIMPTVLDGDQAKESSQFIESTAGAAELNVDTQDAQDIEDDINLQIDNLEDDRIQEFAT